MKSCKGCKHAEWHRTAAGKLHPSGTGMCKYPWKMPVLPASMYWIRDSFIPYGGVINRRKELHAHCAYYEQERQ